MTNYSNNKKLLHEHFFLYIQAEHAVIHWDGKLLCDLTGNETVDRIAVVCTQESGALLLGVPKIERGTGENMAAAAYKLIVDYAIENNVVAMSFDTTAPNTGGDNGACTLLEGKLGRFLLWLACRHHVHEIFLRSAWDVKFPASSAPEVNFFERFRKEWNQIDKSKFVPGIRDEIVKRAISDQKRKEIIEFCESVWDQNFVRDDYRELIELTFIFLDAKPKEKEDSKRKFQIFFRAPGATHHARCMAKVIYALKIFMFLSKFKMSKADIPRLRDFCIFIVLVYVKAWTLCSLPLAAPKQDLSLIKSMVEYEQIDKAISDAVLRKLAGHLWYLSEETIALAFFDDNVSLEEKKCLQETLLSQPMTQL